MRDYDIDWCNKLEFDKDIIYKKLKVVLKLLNYVNFNCIIYLISGYYYIRTYVRKNNKRGIAMSVKISKSSTLLVVSFDYSPERINKIKSISGYKWNPDRKVWTVPFIEDNLQLLKTLFKGEQIHVEFEENEKNRNLIKLMENELKLKDYSFKTRNSYVKHIKRFASFNDKELDYINNNIRKYMLFLLDE